jgi:2-oxoglutarate ferredoxin oxidoreductase subunit beta
MKPKELDTKSEKTWCPGCPNFLIYEGLKRALIKSKKKKEDFSLVTGIGCHAKMFDYVNLNGINSLHGRVPPTCLGLKIGNPNLTVIGISGDGDAYSEGMAHTIHAARYNSDFTYIVHNNQVFALTVGEPTPTTEIGFKDKTMPLGVKTHPINPIKIMLSAGATFVARVFADVSQVEWVLSEAMKHKGFSFVEIIQPCLVFHKNAFMYKEKTYMLDKKYNKEDFNSAMKKAEEFDYNVAKKIPLGIFYQVKKPVYEDLHPQLKDLKKKKSSWKNIKR